MVGVVLAVAACGAPPVATKPVDPPKREPFADAFDDAAITGRVLLNGQPVPEFGIVVVANRWMKPPAIPVRQPGGRFEVHVPAGTFDLIIAGPGFARTMLVEKSLRPGVITDLGDITLKPGFTISGQITDMTGRSVPGAEITVEQTSGAPRD
ncbi:MAG: hypothetical protein H0V17_23845, partial [Deltaproteobacteria bacterium]|nr:hypothetical protein [Deltaproteobacteria bacterium]